MTKHFIGVDIIDHRLVGMPHFFKLNGVANTCPGMARDLKPIRGIATAAVLSGAIWIAMIAMVA